jgi:hypothetical protein
MMIETRGRDMSNWTKCSGKVYFNTFFYPECISKRKGEIKAEIEKKKIVISILKLPLALARLRSKYDPAVTTRFPRPKSPSATE